MTQTNKQRRSEWFVYLAEQLNFRGAKSKRTATHEARMRWQQMQSLKKNNSLSETAL